MAGVQEIPEVVSAADLKKDVAESAAADAVALDSKVAERVVGQVKHYFSDASLNHDNFMRKSVAENGGWVEFSTLIRFNKLRQLLGVPEEPVAGKRGGKPARPAPVAQKFVDMLAATVRGGVGAEDAVEVSETAVRRKEAFEASGEWYARTVHVKGLAYGKERANAIEELTAFFAQHGDVTLLRLRRNPKTKAFKGNLLVEFATVEQAEAVAKMADLVFEGSALAPVLLAAYHDEKQAADEYIQIELQRPGESYPTHEEWCVAHGRQPPAPAAKGAKGAAKGAAPKEFEAVPGMLLAFSGVEGELGIAALKRALGAAGDVRFVDIAPGASEGIVRFREPIAAQVLETHADGLSIEGSDAVLKLASVDEDAEKAFYERAKAASERAASNGGGKRSDRRDGGAGQQRRSKRARN